MAIMCSRLAGSDVSVMQSVMCMAWLYLCYVHVAYLVFCSIALSFLTSVSEKRKYASPSAVEVKNRRKTIDTEETLSVIM
jgi:hypothetical protein